MEKGKMQWTLSVRFLESTAEEEKEILYIRQNGKKAVRLTVQDGTYCCFLFTDEMELPLELESTKGSFPKTLDVIWRGYRVELWGDGVLMDEEWPMGECVKNGAEIWYEKENIAEASWTAQAKEMTMEYGTVDNAQYWAPELGKNNVGDCMPFADGNVYHLFYLKDRRQHKSKWGKGAHQFAHISTRDMVHWEEHPVAVEITHQWEGSICTGSVIKKDNVYYAFYAVRMMDGSSAKVSWATSEDCIHFTKSEKYFTLSAPYETTSVRDPEVFFGADGKYHMLLTTNWENEKVEERSGCLAHLTSDDLESWEEKGPFLVPGFTDQPECSDYFKWNDWYYLIFSNYGTAKYRYSKEPFGPWICPENEIIDGLLYRVPKTAEFGGRRIASGFLCINTEGESYAGNLVLREVRQNADGTLSTAMVKEVLPELQRKQETFCLDRETDGGYEKVLFSLKADADQKMRYTKIAIRRGEKSGSCGMILRTGENTCYEIRIDPEMKTVGVYPEHSNLYYHPTKRILTNVKGLEEKVTLEIVMSEDILDICINEERTLVCRMKETWRGEETGVIGCFVKDSKAEFTVEV